MVTAAILKIPKSNWKSAHASQHSCGVSSSLEHFDFFRIFAVSMETAAIFYHSIPRCTTLHGGPHYSKVPSTLVHRIPRNTTDKMCGRRIRKTRFVIASNNGWHPSPIARVTAAILKIPQSKSASTLAN